MRILIAYVVALGAVLGCGFLALAAIGCARDGCRHLASALLAFCVVAYVAFWTYFLSPAAGRVLTVATIAGTVAFGAWRLARDRRPGREADEEVRVLSLLMLLAGVFYLSLLHLVPDPRVASLVAQLRFFALPLPPDNALPLLLARHLVRGTDPRLLLAPWHSSDRPPLQAGFATLLSPATADPELIEIAYQAVSTAAQLFWIPAVWYLGRLFGATRRDMLLPLSLMIFSGFCFLNSVYVWPKLLAGALGVLAGCFLLDARAGSLVGRFSIASIAYGLALLAHGGAVFALPAILLCARAALTGPVGRRTKTAAIVAAVGVLAMLVAPWLAYQRWYDPPGDQLLKVNLAGVWPLPDPRPFLKALVSAYASRSFTEVLQYKWDNLALLFGGWAPGSFSSSEAWRQAEFRHLFRGLSVSVLGLLLVRRFIVAGSLVGAAARRTVALGAGLSLVFWIVAMFGPGFTSVHLASYTVVLMLLTLATLALMMLPRIAQWALVGAQAAVLLAFWVLTAPPGRSAWDGAPVNPVMAVAAVLSGVALVWIAAGGRRRNGP